MSSHHIIREKQEPALFINNLGTFDLEYIGQLLEWSPTVIVNSAVYDYMHTLSIKIDAVIGDSNILHTQEHTKLISKEGELTTACLEYLLENGYPSVNIIDDDEFKPYKYRQFVNKIDVVIFNATKKIFPVRAGFSKWKPHGEYIYIMDSEDTIITEGLRSTSKNHFVTERDGFYSLKFSKDFIFIAEDL
ncbi:thiamine pyrophosphokinase [Pseudoxanthomonas sp. SGD-10]|nr:thiamine pyrophosphokinase [Pseudoxanthomonas sp. SGD-10]